MRNIFFAILALCFITPTIAQNDSKNNSIAMMIGGFEYVDKPIGVGSILSTAVDALSTNTIYIQDKSYVPQVRGAFEDAANNANRIKLYKEAPKEESDYVIVDCKITSLGYQTKLPSKYPSGTIAGYVECTLNMRNSQTNQVIGNKVFRKDAYEFTVEGAIKEVCKKLKKEFSNYLKSCYPLYGKVLDKGQLKNNKIKELYIDLGSNDGIKKDMVFTVFETKEVAGRVAKQDIGKVKVTEVSGEDISLCKITKGESQISAAFNNGKQLIVASE